MRKPRPLGKATGSHKLKKAQLSSDSSDEDDDVGDMQVCQLSIIKYIYMYRHLNYWTGLIV